MDMSDSLIWEMWDRTCVAIKNTHFHLSYLCVPSPFNVSFWFLKIGKNNVEKDVANELISKMWMCLCIRVREKIQLRYLSRFWHRFGLFRFHFLHICNGKTVESAQQICEHLSRIESFGFNSIPLVFISIENMCCI